MKMNLLLYMITIFIIGCSNKGTKLPAKDNQITDFFESFDSLYLDFKIEEHDLRKYSDTIFDENSNLISNPRLKLFKNTELDFIRTKYPINERYKYYKLSKLKINSYYLICIVQINQGKTELWIMFNMFNSKGDLLDTLTFAGQKAYDHNVYGVIINENKIITVAYYDITPDSTNLDNYYATEIKKEYSILNNGLFNQNEIKRERAYFTDYGPNNTIKRINVEK
jgi:hypothetical protein